MVSVVIYFISAVVLGAIVNAYYRIVSQGLTPSARGQQMTRFCIGSLLTLLPWLIAGGEAPGRHLWIAAAAAVVWMLAFPVADRMFNSTNKIEIDHPLDIAFGLYLFGWLSALWFILSGLLPDYPSVCGAVITLAEIPFLMMAVFVIGYALLYRDCVDHSGLKLVMDTDANEAVEFFRTFPLWGSLGVLLLLLGALGCLFWVNVDGGDTIHLAWSRIIGEGVMFVVLSQLMFGKKKGAFRRSGLPTLYLENRAYEQELKQYKAKASSRCSGVNVGPATQSEHSVSGNPGKVHIVVIGESASSDYMTVFAPQDGGEETTPWLSKLKSEGRGAVFFPHAYSCHFQTVPTLERALTRKNQYNDIAFNDAISMVEMAHLAGMKVYWYSNQGHIGVHDTQISLVAEESDVAKWTNQTLQAHPYDERLLDFFEEIPAEGDKLIVLHLMGSHFGYTNRYPREQEVFPTNGGHDYSAAYRNSIRYTDALLERIYRAASEKWNLQTMVYFSDHGDIPERRRTPKFDGVGRFHIPLVVLYSEDYLAGHAKVIETLEANSGKPFTNDLLYNLAVGLWDRDSNRLDPEFCICRPEYRLTPETALFFLGAHTVASDPSLAVANPSPSSFHTGN